MPYQMPNYSVFRRSGRNTRSLRLRVERIYSPSIRVPLEAEFRYNEADPLAVSLALHTPEGSVVHWVVSRDLLYDGTEEPSGIGDVRLSPSVSLARRVLLLRLEVQGLSCLIEMDLAALQEWLLETYQQVHRGTEFDQINWDETVTALIGGGRNHRRQ